MAAYLIGHRRQRGQPLLRRGTRQQ